MDAFSTTLTVMRTSRVSCTRIGRHSEKALTGPHSLTCPLDECNVCPAGWDGVGTWRNVKGKLGRGNGGDTSYSEEPSFSFQSAFASSNRRAIFSPSLHRSKRVSASHSLRATPKKSPP